MKKALLVSVILGIIPLTTHAQAMDTIGGPDSTTTTMHHCGYLPTTAKLYTSSAATNGIVERKLIALGYRATANGNYDKADRRAVKRFQNDQGLAVDGVVGPITAQRLAYASHPSSHTRSCFRLSDGSR